MCGIVGYIGYKDAKKKVVSGLKRLEYRGYDSSGISYLVNNNLVTKKKKGKIAELETLLDYSVLTPICIGHTRWATHGVPSDVNSHPHNSNDGTISIVHNGIIENYGLLKQQLEKKGFVFKSQTDSEVIANLIQYHYKESLADAVSRTVCELEGTFGILVLSHHLPGSIIAVRKGSPLVIGIGNNETILASDCSAIVEHTRQVVYLNDGEMALIGADTLQITDFKHNEVCVRQDKIDWDIEHVAKGEYPHFMLKEIFEQSETVLNSFRGRLDPETGTPRLDGLNLSSRDIAAIEKVTFIACGTSWHAGLVGEYLIEEYARIPVEVEYASEFRYRTPIIGKNDLVIVISQSGETADTLAALREAKARGGRVLAITNVVGSTIARESDGGLYIHAGPEIGVASTKAFTSQVMVISLLAVYLARHRGMSIVEGAGHLAYFNRLGEIVCTILQQSESIRQIAVKFTTATNFLFLGRGVHFPVALEGALKLKEISYIHAEGYPAAEMKHGPIALIDEQMPVVFIAIKDELYGKVISNMQEVRARGGRIIAVATEGDRDIESHADYVIYIPEVPALFSAIATVIPLQLLAYHIAVQKGCDVDQPRNLAKSVTVE